MADTVRLSLDDAERLAARALQASGSSPDNARSTARALVAAEADGQGGHGLTRVPSYAAQARVGKVDGRAVPRLIGDAPAARRIDAGAGFAYPAIDLAIDTLAELAPKAGTAAIAVFASHHFGQAGRHVERLAELGLVAFAFSNTPRAMAFHGAARARMGTNPLAFAAPIPGRAPLVIDMALSVVARGRIVSAKARGEPIEPGWAVDADGEPTTDAAAALAGTLLPIGGAKGSALALMVEVLCAALAGANYGWEASAFLDAEGGPPRMGQLLIALDPGHFAGDGFAPRMATLAAAVAEDGARLPGDRRLALRAKAGAEGLSIPAALHDQIAGLAAGRETA
ncbi:Ldh family oxidoreductase [Caulobacter sp. KR2-114]|uniref:Ldh family oxidoreductase n=1 Tax=Caulobacter sp. KR2-114 TaxID=3400912 RepID=UPI003C02FD19